MTTSIDESARLDDLTFDELGQYPIVTQQFAFVGNGHWAGSRSSSAAGKVRLGWWVLEVMVASDGVGSGRRSRPVTTAFVLSGGANLGAVQVGMLLGLAEEQTSSPT